MRLIKALGLSEKVEEIFRRMEFELDYPQVDAEEADAALLRVIPNERGLRESFVRAEMGAIEVHWETARSTIKKGSYREMVTFVNVHRKSLMTVTLDRGGDSEEKIEEVVREFWPHVIVSSCDSYVKVEDITDMEEEGSIHEVKRGDGLAESIEKDPGTERAVMVNSFSAPLGIVRMRTCIFPYNEVDREVAKRGLGIFTFEEREALEGGSKQVHGETYEMLKYVKPLNPWDDTPKECRFEKGVSGNVVRS